MTFLSPPKVFERVVVPVLGANLCLELACLGGVPPQARFVNASVTALCLLVAVVEKRIHSPRVLPVSLAGLALVLLATFRAPGGGTAFEDVGAWLVGLASLLLFEAALGLPCGRAWLFRGLFAGVATGIAVAFWQRGVSPLFLVGAGSQAPQYLGRASGTFGNPNHLAALLLMVFPWLLAAFAERSTAVWKRFGVALLGVGAVVAFAFTGSRGVLLAAAVTLIVGLAGMRSRRAVLGVMGVGLVALFFLWVSASDRVQLLFAQGGEVSRAVLWKAAWTGWLEAFWTGHGPGSFAVVFERYRPLGFNSDPLWAHSDWLNLGFEFGVAGPLLLLIAFCLRFWRRFRSPSASALLAFALCMVVDFPLRVPALVLVLALAAADQPLPAGHGTGDLSRRTSLAGAGFCVLLFFWVFPVALSELCRESAGGTAEPAKALRRLELATRVWPWNSRAWSDAAERGNRWLDSGTVPEGSRKVLANLSLAQARQAVHLGGFVPEFWIRLGDSLELAGSWAEAGDAFAEATRQAPKRPWVWYRYAYHLGGKPQTRRLGLVAVDRCLQLDPSFPEAQALQRRLSSPD